MPLRSFTPAEMILSERKRMDRPLFWTVWVGVAGYALAEGRWFYLLAGTFAVAVNMLAVRRAKEVHVHRAFINIGVLCATGILAIEVFMGDSPMLQAVGHYLILLQLCKLFERKTNRDYVQILALSALSIVAATMIYNSPLFAAMVTVHLVLLCHTAMIFTLKRGLDTAVQARIVTESRPLGVERVAWNVIRAWPGAALRRRGALTLTVSVAIGILVFFLTPRSSAPARDAMIGRSGSSAETGFTGQVRLGDHTGKVYQSNTVLQHVRFKVPPGVRVPAGAGSYLRGATFSRYSNSIWSNWGTTKRLRSSRKSVPVVSSKMLEEAVVQEVSMASSLLPNTFTCFPAVQLNTEIGDERILADLTCLIDTGKTRPAHVRYTARSMPYPFSPRTQVFLDQARNYFGSQMPTDPTAGVETGENVKRLARRWCDDLLEQRRAQPERRDELDLRIARRIARHLKNEYTYSLDLSDADPSRDGVEDFLFHTRRGHCEYFASALTVMCRLLGVHARLVTGFAPSEYDSGGDYYVIRGRDAHAWTEVFTPTSDWVPMDSTPPGGREIHGQTRLAPLKRIWERLSFFWYQNVVGYDASVRRKVWRRIKDNLTRPYEAAGESIRNLLIHGVLDLLLVRLAILVSLIGMILEGVLISRWVRRTVRKRRIAAQRIPVPVRQMRFIQRFIAILERRGLRPRKEQTLKEFSGEASRTLHLPTEILDDLTALSYRVRWGQEVPSRDELREAEKQVAHLEELIGR